MKQVYHTAKQLCLFTEDMSIPDDLLLTHPLPEEERKICWSCLPHPQIKHLSEFKVDRQKRDGHSSKCKECDKRERATRSEEEKEQDRQIRKASEDKRREEIRAHDRERKGTQEAKSYRREKHAQKMAPEWERKKQEKEAAKLLARRITEKRCPRCNPPQIKKIEEFAQSPNRKDGHSDWCKECVREWHTSEEAKAKRRAREQQKKQDPAYREAKRLEHREWREKNANKIREQNRIKYATDPQYRERVRRNCQKWESEHPFDKPERLMRRNARRRGTQVNDVDYERILARDGFWCYLCEGEILPHHQLAFDHIIPLCPRPGDPQGIHDESNIHPTHKECNGRKSNRRLEDLTEWDRRGVDA